MRISGWGSTAEVATLIMNTSRGRSRGGVCAPQPSWDDMQLSNTSSILQEREKNATSLKSFLSGAPPLFRKITYPPLITKLPTRWRCDNLPYVVCIDFLDKWSKVLGTSIRDEQRKISKILNDRCLFRCRKHTGVIEVHWCDCWWFPCRSLTHYCRYSKVTKADATVSGE